MAANQYTPAQRLQERIDRAVNHHDVEAVLSAQALQDAESVRKAALEPTDTGVNIKDSSAVRSVALFHLARYNALLPRQAPEELMRSAVLFRFLYRIDPRLVPDHLHELAADDFDRKLALQQQAAAAQAVSQFEANGDPQFIKIALHALKFAVNEFRTPSPERVITLSTLCDALRNKYIITKSLNDLNATVKAGRNAKDIFELVPMPVRAAVLCSLGTALYMRGAHNKSVADVDTSISTLRQALDYLEAEKAGLAGDTKLALQDRGTEVKVEVRSGLQPLLSSLSSAYETRFKLKGDRTDLDKANDFGRRAAEAGA